MCLIGIAYRAHPRYPLLVAANRDEFHARPAHPARFWPDEPRVLAGRDRVASGTWLGLSLDGRFAAVTNFREPASPTSGKRSRGALVADFLSGGEAAADCARRVTAHGDRFGGFSALLMDAGSLWFASNRGLAPMRVAPGVHALSNGPLNSPWPKVRAMGNSLEQALQGRRPGFGPLLHCLRNSRTAPDDELPDTGVGLERERLLSAPFVVSDTYGTRCSTLVSLDADGRVHFREDGYDPGGGVKYSRRFRFHLWGESGPADERGAGL